jgi:hypothetical protein
MAAKSRGNSSAIIVARLLATEGFTDHTANEVERYWKRRSGLSPRQHRQIAKLEAELSEMTKEMSAAERLVLGRFIGLRMKMAFDTGLKIGLQAFAQRTDKPVEKEGNDD